MMSRRVEIAIVLVVVVFLSACTDARRRRVDCTKFVFAPVCRGIAAKRGGIQSQSSDTLENPNWDEREKMSVSRDDYIFDSPSLKQPISLSDLLTVLSRIDSSKASAGRDARLLLSAEHGRMPEGENGLARTDRGWMDE